MSQSRNDPGNFKTIRFIVILSLTCAIILASLASALKEPQERALEADRYKEMLRAVQLYNPAGYFQLQDASDEMIPAVHVGKGVLAPGTVKDYAKERDVIEVYNRRVRPILIDNQGNMTTFEKAGLKEDEYIDENSKRGYAKLPLKLAYEVLSNPNKQGTQKVEGYIIPVAGLGLYDSIYGYIGIATDGNTVLGISWYQHKETPGLGANITETSWQYQFVGKHIFQAGPNGDVDFARSPIGIIVVRGKVADVMGIAPKSYSAVDGMPGATLTGNGVTKAYKDTLDPYRPFFLQLQKQGKVGSDT